MLKDYGGTDVPLDAIDISDIAALSVDCRLATGAPLGTPDQTQVLPVGAFSLSVCGKLADDVPLGEVRIWLDGREVSIVGKLTGRQGVTEITPAHLLACADDEAYRKQIMSWLTG